MARCIDAFRSQLVRLRNRATCRSNDAEEVLLLLLLLLALFSLHLLTLIYFCRGSLFLLHALDRGPSLGGRLLGPTQGVARLLLVVEVVVLRPPL